jgi:hypothetical protein
MYAVRYSSDIRRDFRRGYSYAGWGVSPYTTRRECQEEWPHHEGRYSRELGGWLPALPGLCAAGTGDTPEEAIESIRGGLPGMDDGIMPMYVFPCRIVGTDEYNWDVVVPTDPARRVERR